MLIICNGMIRAGSTLQYNIVRSIIEKTKLGEAHGYFDNQEYILPDNLFIKWLNDKYYHVIKMHDIHPKTIEYKNNPNMKICYIYRDIRDVAASAKNIWGSEGERLYSSLDKAINIYYVLKTFPNVIFQKYEEVIFDLSKSIKEILQFLNIDPELTLINEVLRECTLEKMERIARSPRLILAYKIKNIIRPLIPSKFKPFLKRVTNYKGAIIDRKTHLHPYHISKYKGRPGIWRTVLSDEEIKVISKRYRNWLVENKYL